jgi:carbamoyl-phosphate synthase large subunit
MRDMAIKMMNAIGQFAGGCNVQFSLYTETDEIIAIEINPRVSRSSALAFSSSARAIFSSKAVISN